MLEPIVSFQAIKMKDFASARRWLHIVMATTLVVVIGFSFLFLVCFRDSDIRWASALLLAASVLAAVPVVVMPLRKWMRRQAELPMLRSPFIQWFAELALRSAKGGRKRSAKAAHLLCESGVMDTAGCRFQQAEWKLRQSADMFGELEDIPNQALTLMELGNCRNASGDQDGAVWAYQNALQLWEQIADVQRAGNTWRLLNNLSAAYSEKGDLENAERYCRRALHTARSMEAEALCQLNLADIHRKRRQFAEAHRVLAGSLDKLDGDKDEGFAFGVLTLAMLHDDQEDVHEAEQLYRQARQLLQEKLGPGHIEVARLLERYGALLDRNGRSREGASLIAEAAGIRDRVV